MPAWASAAHAQGVPLILDNTVPTPIGARVFEQGADVAVHSLTKYIGGHGTSIGGAIVDAGSFDWPGHTERFPGLTTPDPSYHGVVWSDALGPAAYVGRARTVLLRNTGASLSPFNAFCSCKESRRCRCGSSVTTTTASRWRATSSTIPTSPGSTTPDSTRVHTARSPTAC